MGFFLSAIVMGCNLMFALAIFSCLSQPQKCVHRAKTWGVLHAETLEQQLKELQTIGHILLITLFFISVFCGVILGIIQHTIP